MLEHFELWLPVVGYEGLYEVSNCGRVRSLARTLDHHSQGKLSGYTFVREGKVLNPMLSNKGYLYVHLLSADHKKKKGRVAQLVAAAWIGPRPGGLCIDHKDGDKRNNGTWNLRYVTYKENSNAGNFDRKTPHGETHRCAKLSDVDVLEIRRLVKEGFTQREIAKMFNICQQNVSKIINFHTRSK